MSKKQQQKKNVGTSSATPQTLQSLKPLSNSEKVIKFISDKKNQFLLIVLVTFALYGNSINNEYALDDGIFVKNNQFVQQGISGIPDLFTRESMYGFFGRPSPISGGRWRPLSLITFAIEKEFFGVSPHLSHFVNLVLLAITGIVMLIFLRKHILKSLPVASLLVVLLFIIHPIHTEAVSNIKSRDELLSWLFLVLTMHCSLNYLKENNLFQLVLSVLFYFLALISKENGISFIAILPLTFYVFTDKTIKSIALATIPFVVVAGIYMFMRIMFVPFGGEIEKNVMNEPYMFATVTQRYATPLLMLGKYLVLLFWPNPLSADYSYNQIPYVNFFNWQVWLSIIVQATLLIYAIIKLKQKSIIAYGILFYFISIFIYSNLLFDIGTFIGERFLYQPSFGFCLAIIIVFSEVFKQIKFKSVTQILSLGSALIIVVLILCSFQTIRRNAEWKNDYTLWTADVNSVPNSARAQNGCAAEQVIYVDAEKDSVKKIQMLDDAIMHMRKAHEIAPDDIDSWLNMGIAYLKLNDLDSTEYCWNRARSINPNYTKLIRDYDPALCRDFMNVGLQKGAAKDYVASINYFQRALKYNKKNADVWYNLGGVYFTTAKYDSAGIAWQECLNINPNYSQAKDGMRILSSKSITSGK